MDRLVAPPASRNVADDARRQSELLEGSPPWNILKWAFGYLDKIALVTSFQSSGLVILHLLREKHPEVPVLFLDTGFHFEETIRFRDEVVARWEVNIVNIRGAHGSPREQARIHGAGLYRKDPETCCLINKVLPLQNALECFDGWISGLRRDQSPARSQTPVVGVQELPSGRSVLKVHPLAGWTRGDVECYLEKHGIPTHPLLETGFESVGCWPCTRRTQPGDAPRAGRWYGFDKEECGIHTFSEVDRVHDDV